MKTRFHATLATLLLAFTLALPAAQAQPVDGIVAVVNNGVILGSELTDAVRQARARMGDQAQSIPINALRSNILDQMILTQLQVDRAQQLGLKVDKQELVQHMTQLAQKTGMNLQQYLQALQKGGVSLADARERVGREILIQKLRTKEVLEKVVVTPQDVTRFLESRSLRDHNNREYRVRHIRIDIPLNADSAAVAQARERAEQLRQQINAGDTTFAAAAKAESDGDAASRGGDMGWIGDAVMPQSFTDIVPQLTPGQVSQVFRGNGAFNLIQLVDVRGSQNLAGGQKVMVDEIEARHIVLQPNALRNAARTQALAAELLERLDAGASFADLAKQYSDDKATASQGGDLGWIQAGMLGPKEAVQVAQMQAGSVSPVLQTHQGFVILKLEDRRQVDKTRDAIRKRARQVIGQRKAQEQGRRWLRKLRDEAYVDVRLPGYQRTDG